jgi:glycosyltransferase involved in cell wall biosynthesis
MMNPAPFFSIVTPTYNRERFLSEMIKSVQAQSFKDYEHIIVDDGSIDGSEELILEFAVKDERIVYIKQENKGRCAARNVGIENSNGTYVCFLDSDDYWKPEHLTSIKKTIESNTQPGLFATGLTWFFQDENRIQKVSYRSRDDFQSNVEFVIANEFAPDCVCVHRDILKLFKFNPDLFINEDLELWARITVDYPVTLVPKNTAVLRVHDGNTSQETKDYISPQIAVFKSQLKDPKIRATLSSTFIKRRQKSFDELMIRQLMKTEQRFSLITATLLFLIRYPADSQNRSKMVVFLYAILGGVFLKKLIRSGR